MVRLGMNLGQIIGDTITVPRSDADIDADFIAENTEIPPVIIPTGGVKGLVSGIKARCQTSRELVADASESGAITIASLVANKFARAFNMRLDKTWLNGSPAAKANIDGILTKADGTTSNLPSGHEITQATAGKITVDEIIAVLSALNQHSRNVAWLVHPTAWGQVMSAAKSIIGADLDSPVPMELLGSPVYKCEAMPATHLLVAIDGEQATQFGFKRNGLEIQASYDRAIEYWQVVWAACLRVVIINSGLTYAAALKKKV
jgi:HK97 family phage major capsid protein